MITKNDIYRPLSKAGIKHSDKLTVHASLRSAGKIENGADERLGLPDRLREKGFVITIKDQTAIRCIHTIRRRQTPAYPNITRITKRHLNTQVPSPTDSSGMRSYTSAMR